MKIEIKNLWLILLITALSSCNSKQEEKAVEIIHKEDSVLVFQKKMLVDLPEDEQNERIHVWDSLNAVISNAHAHDTALAAAYVMLTEMVFWGGINNDTCIFLCDKSIEISNRALAENPIGKTRESLLNIKGLALNNKAVSLSQKNELNEIQATYYKQSLALYEQTNNQFRIAETKRNLAALFNRINEKDSASMYYSQAAEIYQQLDLKSKLGTTYSRLYSTFSSEQRDSSEKYLQLTLTILEELKDSVRLADMYISLSFQSFPKGEIWRALNYGFKALDFNSGLNDTIGISEAHHALGNTYKRQFNFKKALSHYLLEFPLIRPDRKAQLAYNYMNRAQCYYEFGEYEKALLLNFQSDSIMIAGNVKYRGSVLNHIALIYNKMRQSVLAEQFFRNAAITGFAERGNSAELSRIYVDFALFLDQQNQKDSAFVYAKKAVEVAKPLEIVLDYKDALDLLVKLTDEKGRMRDAYNYMRELITVKDLIEQRAKTVNSNELSAQIKAKSDSLSYESLKIQSQLLAEKNLETEKRKRNLFAFVGIAILLIAVGLWTRLKAISKSRNEIQMERDRSEKLLLNILPEEVAEELKAKGSAEAKQFDQVTVLFTDFVDFTGTAEKLSPHILVAELNECFSAFDLIIEKHGLEKIKTIGDAYMAVCGLPNQNPVHAEKAVQAALDINRFMAERKKKENTFDIRLGINSGSVVAGIVGIKKFQYDIWGDTVNVASRMETNGEIGKVNISGTTYELVKDDFTFTYRGKIKAKGKGEIDMYFVEGTI